MKYLSTNHTQYTILSNLYNGRSKSDSPRGPGSEYAENYLKSSAKIVDRSLTGLGRCQRTFRPFLN